MPTYADLNRAVVLTGFNLEVASAAARAGFNTWNHRALYDLIWAVKRVALRHCHGPVNRPPPKDSYYPDRYRPSGTGDNTSRKRPAPPSEPPAVSSPKLKLKSPLLRSKFRAPRYAKAKNRPNTRAAPHQAKETLNVAGTSRDNPVNLLLDSDEDGDGAPAKRQKLNSDNISNVQIRDGNPRPSHITVTAFTNARIETQRGSITQQTDFVSVDDTDLNTQDRMTGIAPLPSWSSPQISPNRGSAATQAIMPVMRSLKVVRGELESVAKSMVSSRDMMKKVFDNDGDLLNLKETLPALTFLSKCLGVAEKEAVKGTKHVDRVVELMFGR